MVLRDDELDFQKALNTTCTRLVGLPLRGVHVFRHFAWLGVVSAKIALSRPAHQYPEGA